MELRMQIYVYKLCIAATVRISGSHLCYGSALRLSFVLRFGSHPCYGSYLICATVRLSSSHLIVKLNLKLLLVVLSSHLIVKLI